MLPPIISVIFSPWNVIYKWAHSPLSSLLLSLRIGFMLKCVQCTTVPPWAWSLLPDTSFFISLHLLSAAWKRNLVRAWALIHWWSVYCMRLVLAPKGTTIVSWQDGKANKRKGSVSWDHRLALEIRWCLHQAEKMENWEALSEWK